VAYIYLFRDKEWKREEKERLRETKRDNVRQSKTERLSETKRNYERQRDIMKDKVRQREAMRG